MKKTYEIIGLTKKEVLEIQQWLFTMIMATESIGEMLKKTVEHFDDKSKLHYALYILGVQLGQAKVKEQLGLVHALNQNEL